MREENFTDLLQSAMAMLRDQKKHIRDVIVWAVSLDTDERAAIIMADRMLREEKE